MVSNFEFSMSDLYKAQGHYADALPPLERALRIYKSTLETNHQKIEMLYGILKLCREKIH
jgi:hypothetical protein